VDANADNPVGSHGSSASVMTQRDDTERLRPKPESQRPDNAEAEKVSSEEGAASIPERAGAAAETVETHKKEEASDSAVGASARYSILGSIHRGGMGEILLARVA